MTQFMAAGTTRRGFLGQAAGSSAATTLGTLLATIGLRTAHVGRPLTYQEALDWGDDLTAGVTEFAADSPAPVLADAEGRYPVPSPGKYRFEYRS